MIQSAASEAATHRERPLFGGLSGSELAAALREESDLTGVDLTGARLDGADLSGLNMFKATLRGASLRNADLSGAELSGADFEGADLEAARLTGTGLGLARLVAVNAFGADLTDATLTGADLSHGSFRCARMASSRIREADLTGADLRAADLRDAELSLSTVGAACFDDADLRGARLRAVSEYGSASWYGVDLRDINFTGAHRLHRHIVDENYLREFRESGPLQRALYRVWWLTSDCGRSVGRWLANIVAVAALFAVLFPIAGVEYGIHEPGALTHFYYSVVTLTGLGYGDIVPQSGWGQILVVLEIGLGYMMLGGLISIFANKMARRGE